MKKVYLRIILLLTVILSISICGCFNDDSDDNWGEDGELQLKLLVNKNEMELNESLDLTYELKNMGNTDLRILYPIGPQIQIFDSNNNSVQWKGAEIPTPPSPTNDDLEELRKGESKSFDYIINTEYWDLQQNESYRIIGKYLSGEQDKITLPYWKGELKSNEIFIIVK